MELRGSYFSKKDAVAVFVTVTVMLGAGVIMDSTAGERQHIGFLLNGMLIFILVLINFCAFSRMKEPRYAILNAAGQELHGNLAKKYMENQAKKQKGVLKAEIKEAFRNSDFRKAFLPTCYGSPLFIHPLPLIPATRLKN